MLIGSIMTYKINVNSVKLMFDISTIKYSEGLKLGGSKHWSEALKAITGESKMSAAAILEYFAPLHEFLIEANKRLKKQDEVRDILAKYNEEASIQNNKLQLATWNKTTDLKNETKQEIYVKTVSESAKFTKDQIELHFRNLNPEEFTDERIKRQIKFITNLEINALNEEQLRNFTNVLSGMINIYNTAEFCEYKKANCTENERLTLDPGIKTQMLANWLY